MMPDTPDTVIAEFRGGPLDGEFKIVELGTVKIAVLDGPPARRGADDAIPVRTRTGTYRERLTRDGLLFEWQGWSDA